MICQRFSLDMALSLIYDNNCHGVEYRQGQRIQCVTGIAGLFLGLTWCCVLVWTGGVVGFNSPQPCPKKILPASGCSRLRGMSSGMSRRQSWKPAVILALWPEESKGQNDLFELLHFE